MLENTTCLIHIYNEEYLLPFWLYHHKNIFDNILIIDYCSNDKSINLVNKICSNCKIISRKNYMLNSIQINKENKEWKVSGVFISLPNQEV